jgi:hypothetical protein
VVESQARGRMRPDWTSTVPIRSHQFHTAPYPRVPVTGALLSTGPRCSRPEGGGPPGSSAPSTSRTVRASARAALRRPGDPCRGRSERSSDPSRPRARRSRRVARARLLPRSAARWRSAARHPRFHASQETLASFCSSVSQGGDTAIRVHQSCSGSSVPPRGAGPIRWGGSRTMTLRCPGSRPGARQSRRTGASRSRVAADSPNDGQALI